MKLKFFGCLLLVLPLFSCRNYIKPLSSNANPSTPTNPGTPTNPSTPVNPVVNDATVENHKYFVRLLSGGKFKLDVAQKSDIYYLITNSVKGTPFSLSCQTGTFTSSGSSDFVPNYVIKNTQDTFDVKNEINIDFPHNDLANDVVELTEEEFRKMYNRSPLYTNELGLIKNFEGGGEQNWTEGSYDEEKGWISPLGDYKGKEWEDGGEYKGICRLVKRVKIANGEYRYLVIYVQSENANWTLSDDYINFVADKFLCDELDNDIYDKVTGFLGAYEEKYGTYEGVMEYAKEHKEDYYANYFPHRRNTITIFFHDIPGTAAGYVSNSGWQGLGRYLPRVLIHVENYGEDIYQLLSTLAHEFQHCVFYGSFNEEFVKFFKIDDAYSYSIDENVFKDRSENVNEILSGAVQMFLSKYLYDMGKSASDGDGWNNKNIDSVIQTNYRHSFYKNFFEDNINIYEYDYQNGYYFALYLLQNYGKTMIQRLYRNGVRNLDYLPAAINEVFPGTNMTTSRLLADWHTSNMLTSIPDPDIKYPYTPRGADLKDKLKSKKPYYYWILALSNYKPDDEILKNEKLYDSPLDTFGTYRDNLELPLCNTLNVYNTYSGSSRPEVYPNISIENSNQTIITRRVIKDVGPGVYEAAVPTLPEGVTLTVVAVPK